MPKTSEPAGCRDGAITTAFLLGLAIASFAIGLTMIGGDECTGACETLGLTLLYAGGPVSAVFGVLTGGVVVAWPLDILVWVLLGLGTTRLAARRGRRPLAVALAVFVLALGLGLVLSQFVELAVQ